MNIPATPEEIDSRIRRMCLLLEAKWDILDKAVIERRPEAERIDSSGAPMPGRPILKDKD